MDKNSKTLVFVQMKKTADFLASYLCQSDLPTTSIHGDRLQVLRICNQLIVIKYINNEILYIYLVLFVYKSLKMIYF